MLEKIMVIKELFAKNNTFFRVWFKIIIVN